VLGVSDKEVTLVPDTQLLELAFKFVTKQLVVLNSCSLGALSKLDPIPLNEMVGKLLLASNTYQTSGEPALPQKVLIDAVAVAPPDAARREPGMLEQPVPETNKVALAH
jgi:hypothetical protein